MAVAKARILLGAFGDPGHAFPIIALGCALRDRGHEVTVQTWERWRTHVRAEGLHFAPAPEYTVFPTPPAAGEGPPKPLDFYEAIPYATFDTEPLVRELSPHAIVADILTLAPALAGELHGVPVATSIPHIYPEGERGFPIYSFGARLPRTAFGRAAWDLAQWPVEKGLESGRLALNGVREQVGLRPLPYFHNGISRELVLLGSFPQLEYPRRWARHVQIVGPLMWEPPSDAVAAPPAPAHDGGTEAPVVLIAPSTSQDPDHRLLRAALDGLADLPVRVIATWNRRLPPEPLRVPENARVVEWLSYSKTMPTCDLVVCHAGNGTIARALTSGCPVVACPVAGDMNEAAARVDWAGVGVRLPRRFISPRPLRLAVERALADSSLRMRAREVAAWYEANDPAGHAASLVERFAGAGAGADALRSAAR